MPVTQLRKLFGDAIRQHLLVAKVRQTSVAEALSISDSAVSQILSGKIVPQHEQLVRICELLKLTSDQSLELESLLVQIRNGERELRSPFNQLIFANRRVRELDIKQLSYLTGISSNRLNLLETSYNVIPTVDEVKRLAEVLECTQDDLLISARLKIPSQSGVIDNLLRENFDDNTGDSSTIPLLMLEQLQAYRCGKETLIDFANSSALHQVARGSHLGVSTVAILCSAQKLNMGSTGEITLLVAEERPLGYRRIELCLDSKNVFFVREKIRDSWYIFNLFGSEEQDKPGYAILTIPVLEIVLRPIKPRVVEVG